MKNGQFQELLELLRQKRRANNRKNIIKDTLILFAITLVAGLGLGLVYNVTANSRAMQEEKTKIEAYNTVMPGLGSFDNVSFDSVAADKYIKEQINKNETEKTIKSYNATINEVIKAKDKSGNDLGYIITVTDNEAYGGSLQMTVGIKDDGTVMGISFLSLSETPGLGMKAKDDDFMSQFSNKKVDFFKYTKSEAKADNEINAISSATITSNDVTHGVNGAIYCVDFITGGGK